MKEFKDFEYVRPNLDQVKEDLTKEIDIINTSNNLEEVKKAILDFNKIAGHFQTMETITSIRHSIDTTDEFYDKENEFFDENGPYISEIVDKFNSALLENKYEKELKDAFGEHLFKMLKVQKESFSPEIIPELQEESKLVTKYGKLIASAKITFDGKELNIPQMGIYMQDLDRNVRHNAETAVWKFYEEHISEIDEIYNNLVKVRTRMAKKLGYDNYIELGYKRLGRTDYNASDVKGYRDQVYRDLVPIASKIFEKQAKRIGIKDFKSYDMGLEFLDGNANPVGDLDYKLDMTRKMYHELSKETGEFVDVMLDHKLIDLMAKPGKEGGGYCTSLIDYKVPFVFANFNDTADDVGTLTHEFGHAFQNYSSRDFEIIDYTWPTLEACEIHSMSMEFFTWPWMDLFFKDKTDKYKYSHLAGSITFIPYGVLVDEFQHWVYENYEATPEERKNEWRRLEKKYMPYKVYDNEFLDKGNYWIRQSHIFSTAFYYIDYTLAQNCAHQFWVKDHENHEVAWRDYYNLCKAGGSKSFLDLLKVANLRNPFVDGTVKYAVKPLQKWLDEHEI